MASGDFPVISQPTDSTRIDIKPSPPKAFAVKPPPPAAPKPAAAPADARKATQSVPAVAKPPAAAAPKPAAPPPPPAAREEEDPEKLLREYADRQKTKVNRLEVELVELRKAAAEREQFRLKSEAQAREIAELRAKLEAASRMDAVIKDLQGKVDAAILANGMLTDENGKLKAKAQELGAAGRKAEERATFAEKGLAESSKALAAEKDARKDADARIAAAAHALQPRPPAPKK
ncbi:MAG TPA: hypothetical protein VF950_21095 [Planctomycetota bacterium]